MKKNGVKVQIFERDDNASIRLQSYRLHLDADGISAIQESLPEKFFQLFELTSTNPLPYTTILDTGLKLSKRFSVNNYSKTEHHVETGVAKHLNVNRGTVREILLMDLDDICHYGAKFDYYEADETGITAFLKMQEP